MRDLETYAHENNIPIMKNEGIEFLTEYIKDNEIKNILEIGTAIGYSAIMMASADEDIQVTSIERDSNLYEKAVVNIQNYNLQNRIQLILGDALNYETDNYFDLVFIDAAKSKYIDFFEKYKNNLNKNGVIVTDNLSFHGFVENPDTIKNRNTKQLVGKIQRYIDFLKENTEFTTVFYNIGDGISISKRKS